MRKQRGMTLIEIMVVIAILGMLSAAVAVKVLDHLKRAKVEVARLDIHQMSNGLKLYFTRHGAFPRELKALETDRMVERVRNDPWGNPYLYMLEGGEPVLTSFGPDGAAGGGDDISSRDPDS